MTRRCGDCEWGEDPADGLVMLNCREGPIPVAVKPEHWCGRFRRAERLCGAEVVVLVGRSFDGFS